MDLLKDSEYDKSVFHFWSLLTFLSELAWQWMNPGVSQVVTSSAYCCHFHVGVSKNRGTPKSSILIGFSIINHPFWGTPIFGNTHVPTILYSQKSSTQETTSEGFGADGIRKNKVSGEWHRWASPKKSWNLGSI